VGLFNASMDGQVRRAIDIHYGGKLNEPAFNVCVVAALSNQEKAQSWTYGHGFYTSIRENR
jgi:hypothetical protein